MQILKLRTELQNTIKEHSFLLGGKIVEENSLLHEEGNRSNDEEKSFDSVKWVRIHSGYLVFLSEALAVSR